MDQKLSEHLNSSAPDEKFNGWAFQTGSVSLNDNETIHKTWVYESTSMSLHEWMCTVCTFELYFLISRCLLQRKRTYAISITDMHIIIKEVMHEKQFLCGEIVLENQATFPISNLTFITAEELDRKLFGFMPESVVLEMRFGQYPKQSQYPYTSYRSVLSIMLSPFGVALKAALKSVLGLDFDAPPLQFATQLLSAIPLLPMLSTWIQIGIVMATNLCFQALGTLRDMLLTAVMDPSIGPRQAIGAVDACSFRLEVDVSEDPECVTHMREILAFITNAIPERHAVPDVFISAAPKFPVNFVPRGSTPVQVNGGGKYGSESEYNIIEDYVHMADHEIVLDMCPCNPEWSYGDWQRVISTFGMYYITDLADHIDHRVNAVFTNKRIMQHSLLLSPEGAVRHSRLDIWVVDRISNMSYANFRGNASLRADSFAFGPIMLPFDADKAFSVRMLRCLFTPKVPLTTSVLGLTNLPMQSFRQMPELKNSIYTNMAIKEQESIDVAVHSDQILYPCTEDCITCGRNAAPKMTVTSTNECLYLDIRKANGKL